MSLFKRLKELLIALVTALFGIILLFAGEEGQLIVIDIICLCLFFEGIRLLVYYLWMARHMVEGKRVLIRSIIILDLGMLTLQMVSMSDIMILIYLLSIFAFTGAIDILRSMEAKRNGGYWKLKFINGCIHINEPDCAVKAALEDGKISRIRYRNYCEIYEELRGRRPVYTKK